MDILEGTSRQAGRLVRLMMLLHSKAMKKAGAERMRLDVVNGTAACPGWCCFRLRHKPSTDRHGTLWPVTGQALRWS